MNFLFIVPEEIVKNFKHQSFKKQNNTNYVLIPKDLESLRQLKAPLLVCEQVIASIIHLLVICKIASCMCYNCDAKSICNVITLLMITEGFDELDVVFPCIHFLAFISKWNLDWC